MRCGPVSPAPDPALVERFKVALDRLNPGGAKIGLAVSGGPDSMAMLLLANAAIPSQFEVATVNHGLRPEAADECALVAAACAERGVECAVLDAGWNTETNLQARARLGRYAALGQWAEERGLIAVATAHHVDDQAETLLMRLNRGSGVAGLAGVREDGWIDEWPDIGLIRPLLTFRREELASVVAVVGAVTVSDPSNVDDRFDRARIRKALGETSWLDVEAIARSAACLADADEALRMYTRRAFAARCKRDRDDWRIALDWQGEPHAVILRLVEQVIGELGGEPRGTQIANLVQGLYAGVAGNVGGVLATVDGKEWIFRPEPPRRAG